MFPIIISLMHSDMTFSVEYMNEEMKVRVRQMVVQQEGRGFWIYSLTFITDTVLTQLKCKYF